MTLQQPNNWLTVRLGEVCDITMGQSPPSEAYNSSGSGLPFLQGKTEFTDRSPVPTKYCTLPLKVAKQGSVLISVRAPVGDVNIADQTYIIGRGLSSLSLKSGDNDFLYYLLLCNKEKIAALGSGTTFESINRTVLDNFMVPFPPIPEQNAIAHALRVVQDAKAARQYEVALERERKAALMQQLFAYGTRNEPRKHTDIGQIPSSWQLVKFAEAVDITNGQVNPVQEPYKAMLHVGSENIESGSGRLLNLYTNEQNKIISGNYLFTDEDVLYSKIRPYLNKVALPNFTGTCSADIYPLQPRKEAFTRQFLFHYLLSEQFKVRAVSFQDRTGIPKINRDQLGLIPLIRPSLPEQVQIAAVLSACDAKIAALSREIALLDELFRVLLDKLMTGEIRATALINTSEEAHV